MAATVTHFRPADASSWSLPICRHNAGIHTRGRTRFQITSDPSKVTCTRCLKLMEVK